MPVTRRLLIAALPPLLAVPVLAAPVLVARPLRAQPADPRMAERSMGQADARVVVTEWFSLTCTHCAAFQKETFPKVREKLINTGRVRYVWRDFPLDQVALTAAMVARALPPERYEPFITVLLGSQDRWAFRGVNSTEELAKYAALAGLSRAGFDAAVGDAGLKRAILADQEEGEKKFGVNSTPSFVMNGKTTSGAVSFDDFARAVDAAAA